MAESNLINTPRKRAKLASRSRPYWYKISKGRFLGYRRNLSGGVWVARSGERQQNIGPDLEYEEALELAISWCRSIEGGAAAGYTVADAIDDYVQHLQMEKGPKTAMETRQRLAHHLPTKPANSSPNRLMRTPINKVTTRQVLRWRDSMVKGDEAEVARRSKNSANRTLTCLKAAFNLAYQRGEAASDNEWRRVKRFPGTTAARTLFLKPEEVKRLMDSAEGAFLNLCKACLLTGARVGELTAAVVSDFDPNNGVLHVSGKTGGRPVYLSSEGVRFFKRQCQNKLPGAYLLPNHAGNKWKRENWRDEMRRMRKVAKLPGETVIYSLRHYSISRMLLAGVNHQVVAENTGTSIEMIQKHYGKFTPSDRKQMLDGVVL